MSDEPRPEPSDGTPKRRGKAARKHTVGRVILISAVVLALITGQRISVNGGHTI